MNAKRLFLGLLLFTLGLGADMIEEAVQDFDLDSYLGTWYEIARMDHSFERGLSAVTANYTMKDNGMVRVLNKGYKSKKSKWSSASGVAKFASASDIGSLRVSFFRPFYGAYHVVSLAEDYSSALVAGDSEKYLWILSRTPTLDSETLDTLLARAQGLGYDTDKLIIVDQSKNL